MHRKPRHLRIAFIDRAQTHFGGLFFLQEFVGVLQLRHRLSHDVQDARVRTRYSVGQMILAVLYPVVLGLGRLEAASLLRVNGIFQYLTGLPRFPNPSTLRRFLYQASAEMCADLGRLVDRLCTQLLQHPHQRSRLLLDLDSTNLLVYGHQEGARYVYNPGRRGARSYEPLICCEANSGLFWAGCLRPGGKAGADEVIPFLRHAFEIMPGSVREVRLRADAGFYSDDTLTWLEDQRAEYVIVARLTRPLQERIAAARYRSVSANWALTDISYQANGWPGKRRIVAVRKQLTDRDPQPTLFTLHDYAYHAYVTNLTLLPEHVWHFYNDRANLELLIKELKHNYQLGYVPTRRLDANTFYFQILRLAYNLVTGFQSLCLPHHWNNATLATIRNHFFLLPAVLAKPQGRPVLRFPAASPARQDCETILKALRRLDGHFTW